MKYRVVTTEHAEDSKPRVGGEPHLLWSSRAANDLAVCHVGTGAAMAVSLPPDEDRLVR